MNEAWCEIGCCASASFRNPARGYGSADIAFANAGRRAALTSALRENGWRYQDKNGLLHIFK